MRGVVFGGVVAALLSGCAALPGGGPAPLDTYELSAPQVAPVRARHRRKQILVAEPSALKPLDGENIVIRPQPGSIAYLKGAQWSDRLPRIIQARLVETLQRADAFGGVGKPGEGLAIDYQVVTEIRSFEIRFDGAGRAQVALHVRILDDRNGVVRAARLFETSAALGGRANSDYASALDSAFGAAAAEIVAWVDGTV